MKQNKLRESDLTQELLNECFEYSNEEGTLTWKHRPSHHFLSECNRKRFNTPCAGKRAGYYNKRTDSKREGFGYWRICISLNGCRGDFKLHRIVWLMHKGYLPEMIDHKDIDTHNNRIGNLREANVKLNSYNTATNHNSKTGYKGVRLTPRKKNPYKVAIQFEGITYSLGVHSCKCVAAAYYNLAATLLYKDFAYINPTKERLTKLPDHLPFFTTVIFELGVTQEEVDECLIINIQT